MKFEGNDNYTAVTEFKINVLLGKNGYGKSTALKAFERSLRGRNDVSAIRYITPERGGKLLYEAGIEQNIMNNIQWINDTRRVNRFEQFRQQSAAQFRRLELMFLRKIEKNETIRQDLNYSFESVVDKINSLLDNIEIRRVDAGFKLHVKNTGQELNPDVISSGESELISLAIECLVFYEECDNNKINVLLFDEPDVHLHPDLQAKLMKFIINLIKDTNIYVFIATHSTAVVGALDAHSDIGVHLMKNRQKELSFSAVSEMYRKILPVFGAHPLSSLFNETPIFLVEGEDDVRIWQQAVRSSRGKIGIYPCSVDGVDNLSEWEKEVISIINSVYDDARAYSLRDRDEENSQAQPDNLGPMIRCWLNCRASENLLLSDEVLDLLKVSWDGLKEKVGAWLTNHEHHDHYNMMREFRDTGYQRLNFDLKEIRNDLMGIIGSAKPWEVAVGQVIGQMIVNGKDKYPSLVSYLGDKLVDAIFQTVKIEKRHPVSHVICSSP